MKWQHGRQRKLSRVFFDIKKHLDFVPVQDMFKLFDSIVKPILGYGADVWGYQYVEKKSRKFI